MLRIITFFLLFVSTVTVAQQNTILLIADDVSPDYFSFYSGADTAITPNLSGLANSGVVFETAWAYPLCSPTRSSIFTGRYGFRTGMGTVVAGPTTNQLSTSETSIAKILRTQAAPQYGTALVGKWHLQSKPGNLNNPALMGFQFYSGNFAGAIGDYYNYERITNGIIDTVTTYATTQTINDAISWLDTIPANQPFFLWIGFNAPHDPFHKPPSNLISNPSLPGTPAHINTNKSLYFKAAIEALDAESGRLMQYLNSKGILDSTNFIFIGDNGSPGQVSQNPITNRSKGTIYDYGVRVPMFVSGPSVVAGGRRSSAMVSTVDLFSTIAELSNVNNWNPNNVAIDTRSMMPIIKNQSASQRSFIFSEQFGTSGTADGKSIRNTNYHLIRFDSTGNQEFYNLSIDQFESTNLLLNIDSMTATDISNYQLLCDSLSALVGSVSCLPLSTQNTTSKNIIALYPNPAYNQIRLTLPPNETFDYEILDITGQSIINGQAVHNQQINIIDLATGYYLLRFQQYKKVIPFAKF